MSQEFGIVSPAPVEKPLSLWEVWTSALTRPSVRTFERLMSNPKASRRTAHIWIFISALLGLAIFFAVELAQIYVTAKAAPAGANEFILMSLWFAFVELFVGPPLGAILLGFGLIISIGITQAIARRLGGTGTYSRLVYAFAAYLAPLIFICILILVAALASHVPAALFRLLFPLLVIYGLVLNVIAVKAVNQFGWGRAIVSNLLIFLETVALPTLVIFHFVGR